MVSRFSPCDNSASHGSQESLVPQTTYQDQLLASTSESCSGIPRQLSASGPNRSQQTKTERADSQASKIKNEVSRSRNRAAVPHLKNKGNKKTQQQPNGRVHVTKPSVE
uniref:Uncharacterized protein n=1 Tax=Arundo donax TaxID=35708 RepID=A0A0A9HQV8_ARUDO